MFTSLSHSNIEMKGKKKRKYNIESLHDESTKLLYQQRLNDKLKQNEFADTGEMCKYIKNCIHEAAKEALGEKELVNRGRKAIFWDAEIGKERQNKKQLFLKWLSTKDDNDKVQYKTAQAKIRRMVTNFRNKLWDKKCLEIQSYLGSKKSSECWKFIKNVRSSNGGKSQFNLISADTWEKYYSKLLIEDCKEFLGKNERLLEDDIENAIEIDSKTIKQIIMRMKNGRAAGPGDIPIELIKSGRQKLLEMITILLNKIINGEKVPEEWKVAIITSIHTKGDKRECKNYRGSSVINTFNRIYGKILANL